MFKSIADLMKQYVLFVSELQVLLHLIILTKIYLFAYSISSYGVRSVGMEIVSACITLISKANYRISSYQFVTVCICLTSGKRN